MKKIISIIVFIVSIPVAMYMAGDWYKLQPGYGLRTIIRSDTLIKFGIDSLVTIKHISTTIDSAINRNAGGLTDDSTRRTSKRYVVTAVFPPVSLSDTTNRKWFGWQNYTGLTSDNYSAVICMIAPEALVINRISARLYTFDGATTYYNDTTFAMPGEFGAGALDSINIGQSIWFEYYPASMIGTKQQQIVVIKGTIDGTGKTELASSRFRIPEVRITGFTGRLFPDGAIIVTVVFEPKLPGRKYY